ncbi:MAG: NADP-dependent malic enzyme [Patescibacteria group bacterium]|nr:NADP-dependent malic enzyme [Patescibacteria group bacterium]
MSDFKQESLELHRLHQGKISTGISVPINNKHDLSLAYTPGVAAVCLAIAEDKEIARTHSIKGRTIAVISDGSAVLGLGNIGPEAALPVMEGKCALFKSFANVDAFPICLDTQDVEEIIKTIKYLAPVFGGINLEDIAAPRCFEIERRLQAELDIPVMHDDQHGTATVVLAALINALKLRESKKEEVKVVVSGAGAAGNAIVRLLLGYGIKNIFVCDRQGLLYAGRPDLSGEKFELASLTNLEKREGDLATALVEADVFIGVSSAGLVNTDMIKSMAARPVVFALANPVPEIMPEEAEKAGAYVVASGRSDFKNQINNVLIFPGVFRGALDNKVKLITDEMLVRAAEALAGLVEDLSVDKILPDAFDARVAPTVAKAIK